MADNTYQVVFTGEFSEGLTRGEILTRLTELLRKQPAELRALFHGPGAVIIARTSLAMAQKYVTSLNQTGALCTIREREPLAVKSPPAAAPPPPAAVAACAAATAVASEPSTPAADLPAQPVAPPQPAAATGPQAKPAPTTPNPKRPAPRTITPLPGPSDITLSPLLCANAGGISGGITTNRRDIATLSFSELKLLAAFKSTENLDEIKLLLFPRSSRRPLLIEGNTIAFAQFPGVADGKLFATFRKFLIMIYRSNPSILLDHATAQFMKGAPPPQFAKDPVILISDLHRAYVAAAASG
jgi:hypothetical protein